MKSLVFILLSLVFFSSCFKEEEKRKDISNSSSSIKIGEDYGTQVFFNIATQKIVSQNKWEIWDLAFFAQENDFYIKLNHAANMKALKTNISFDDITEYKPNWKSYVDLATGNRDSIALKFAIKKKSNDTTYYKNKAFVLDLGALSNGEKLGYKKLQLMYTYQSYYHIKYADLDGSNLQEYTIKKDNSLNFVYFSFKNNGKIVNVEPDRSTWDLLFTRSTDVVYNEETILTDYSVTSVLINPYATRVYVETETKFQEIKISNIKKENLTNQLNIIGYYWKFYDLDKSVYNIIPNKFYIIKDINNYYYKMKFIGFLDPKTNLRGTISFEYELL